MLTLLIISGKMFSLDAYQTISRLILFIAKKTRLSLFLSYVSFFQKIKAYLEGTSNLPFVVHATSGSGKTTVLAMAASKTKAWLSANVSVVVRYEATYLNIINWFCYNKEDKITKFLIPNKDLHSYLNLIP